ncbi:Pimeloyl-ACP methyl ester carboxylesterase [Amycolatopsis arida]|uniref:Pimeloyl-ACP methyl ester carboxylesterase n=1 Tax=Amycolatopsis arida TaxID=587909 RepID=A0A1I6AYY6_9PSEU|nr:alpha/beta hydrolase [Amycolatopsis arida]TDX83917.1 pimeloyl-ACP methyl ester carboxylesterase [Amycolatopsis arida]SFQ73890.1 Pimeloyl-ACP methyl ester carboxylesterase [Amycolatopsis arida]
MTPPDPSTTRIDGPWTHRDVSANGIRLHVAEAGSGPLVLLLHGFAEFWWAWRHQLLTLAEAGYRAVAADLRGYGDSDKPPRGYDAWTLSGDIAGLVRALGEPRAHLVGHAWGGMLAWATAALHPRVVESVSVLGGAHPLALRGAVTRTALRRRDNQARALGHLFRFQVPMVPERRLVRREAEAVERMLREWSGPVWPDSADFGPIARTLRAAMLVPGVAHSALEYYRWAFRAQFRGDGRRFTEAVDRRARVPVLQLHGDVDPCVLPGTARASAPWLGPRSRFEALPGVGHFPHLECPERTGEALLAFLPRQGTAA